MTREEEHEAVVAEFSEGEIDESDEDEAQNSAPADDLDDGFDFSGTVCADVEMRMCGICKKPFDVVFDGARQELVTHGVVMLRHERFHLQCVRSVRPPGS